MVSIEQQSRSRLVQYYLTKNQNKKVAVRHYSDVGMKRSSFYNIFLPKGKLEAVAKKENELKIFFGQQYHLFVQVQLSLHQVV